MTQRAPYTPAANDRYFSSPTRMRLEYWHKAPDGRAPQITAPWGETTTAYSLPVAGMLFYNPYSSRETSSQRFVEWQFARATTAVHGMAIPLEGYEDARDLPPTVGSSIRVKVLAAGALLCFALFMHVLGELSRLPRVSMSRTLAWMTGLLPSVPVLSALFLEARYGSKNGTAIVVPLVHRQLIALSNALPETILVVIAVAAVPVLALCAVLMWQFSKAENASPIRRIPGFDQAHVG